MFLTTEPNVQGRRYNALWVIHQTVCTPLTGFVSSTEDRCEKALNKSIERALNQLHLQATDLQADGVVGVHLSTSLDGSIACATVMGTAIKFF